MKDQVGIFWYSSLELLKTGADQSWSQAATITTIISVFI